MKGATKATWCFCCNLVIGMTCIESMNWLLFWWCHDAIALFFFALSSLSFRRSFRKISFSLKWEISIRVLITFHEVWPVSSVGSHNWYFQIFWLFLTRAAIFHTKVTSALWSLFLKLSQLPLLFYTKGHVHPTFTRDTSQLHFVVFVCASRNPSPDSCPCYMFQPHDP